jgi:uncharacterized protein (DUF427 family)
VKKHSVRDAEVSAMQSPNLEPGQEWVWAYPRPPLLECSKRLIRVEFAGREIARSTRAWRVLETSHPPTFYIPREDVAFDAFVPVAASSLCEWKGMASYYDVVVGERVAQRAAWTYDAPRRRYAELAGCIAFYPGRIDAAYVDNELVVSQPGDFYGGWITHEIVGPFKGHAGTEGW